MRIDKCCPIGRSPFSFFALGTVALVLFIGTIACDGTGAEGGREDEEFVEEVSEEEAAATMAQVLIDRGLVEPSSTEGGTSSSGAKTSDDPVFDALGAADYVLAQFNERGTLMLRLWVGPDRQLIPNGEWRDANPDACEGRLRYMKAPTHLLNFKVPPSIREITVQYIEVETGKIIEQQTGRSDGDDWLREAITMALDDLIVRFKKAESPCGAKIRLDMIFESMIKEEVTYEEDETYTTTYEVELETELDFVDIIELSDEEEDWYEGYGELVYTQFTSSEYGTCTVSDGGQWGTFELTIPETAADPVGSIEMRMNDGEGEGGTAVCSATDERVPPTWGASFAWLHQGEFKPDPLHYLVRDWKAVTDDSDVIARKVYDQTLTDHSDGDTVILTEKTTIELRRRSE